MIYSFNNSGFRDPETGVYNQTYFMEVFHREWFRHLRDKQTLSLLYIHPLLHENNIEPHLLEFYTSKIQQSLLRATDMLARMNQHIFAVGLFNTDESGTERVIHRINEQLSHFSADYRNAHGVGIESTIVACVCVPDKELKPERLFMTVDELLHHPEIHINTDNHKNCVIDTLTKDKLH
ncbi:diguanylate cyclase [Shewanella avicenniae]|uniref:Diguanylate cyclase n=1 Tax=Shewanella avicenniae TaxID=2814294 RepID=A0ABX7QU19_9GAMM|nr:diguanylate cyclase [Shewanella avicenniae]QSX34929.1 diguanylate cyclase [Shewanella avicenniae]